MSLKMYFLILITDYAQIMTTKSTKASDLRLLFVALRTSSALAIALNAGI